MKSLLLSAACFVALSIEAFSQTEQPALKPVTPAPTATRSSYVLEVSYNSALPPAYIKVHGTETKPRWIWVTRFNHVPGWQYPEGVQPIRAVKFEAQYNGETADVRVTVLRGSQGFDQEDLVATYHLGLDDPRVVTKLADFGVEPARITLMTLAPTQPQWPGIINQTNSVTIEKISLSDESLPGYQVVFRNTSDKKLTALSVDVTGGNRGPISTMLQGEDGLPLIEPGGSTERYLHAITEVVRGAVRVSILPVPGSIKIRGAVFADGSYEGYLETACSFEGFQKGRKLWLTTVIPLLDSQLGETTAEGTQAAVAFKERLLALRSPASNPTAEVSAVSRDCQNLRSTIAIAFNGQTLQLLREVDSIITTRPAPPINFRSWLKNTADRYHAWFARL